MSFYVCRQSYWGVDLEDGRLAVEVNSQGSDYSNPGELLGKYPGEQREYADPVQAIRAAVKICLLWRRDNPEFAPYINIACGATGGYTMYFEPMDFAEALGWAREHAELLTKCDECGEICNEHNIIEYYDYPGKYCSEWCGTRSIEDMQIDSLLLQLDDEHVPDDAEVYTNEYCTYFTPEEVEEIGEHNLTYCGTAGEVRARFWNRWQNLKMEVRNAN